MKFVTGRMIKESVEDVVRSIADDKNVNLVEG